jgi:predicted metal-dependent enzyme (double-stranded beta helix superfamily)
VVARFLFQSAAILKRRLKESPQLLHARVLLRRLVQRFRGLSEGRL